jgi:hypothetical protein
LLKLAGLAGRFTLDVSGYDSRNPHICGFIGDEILGMLSTRSSGVTIVKTEMDVHVGGVLSTANASKLRLINVVTIL